jgi:metal-responsive CopG/Arc/MetJ family transcriptional regulator
MKQKPYTLYLPDELLKDIEAYQKDNYISSRNTAILQLIAKSLNQYKKEKTVVVGVINNG